MGTSIESGEITWQADAEAVAAIVGRDADAGRVYDVAYQYYLDQGFAAQHADEHAIMLQESWDDFYPPRPIPPLWQSEEDARAAAQWVRYHQQASHAACRRQAQAAQAAIARARTTGARTRARRAPGTRQAGSRRGGDDGSGSSDGGDSDPEPRHYDCDIFDYGRLAARWHCSPRSLANNFSSQPDSLPPHITIPSARGPRWRLADVLEFEAALRRQPDPPRRGRGRPRIAGGRP